MSRRNTPEDFWVKVHISSNNECWPWQGKTNNSGYGSFCMYPFKVKGAHWFAYYLGKGAIPVGLYVLHHCDNRICCNPDHLFLGTQSDNAQDSWNKGRNYYHTSPRPKGEGHANAKLTNAQAEEIRRRYATQSIRQVDLAAEYGVSQRVISLVIRNEAYRREEL